MLRIPANELVTGLRGMKKHNQIKIKINHTILGQLDLTQIGLF